MNALYDFTILDEAEPADADAALDSACNWLAFHPRLTTLILCTVIYGAFYFAGTS